MYFGCGSRNRKGLRLQFTVAASGKQIRTRWVPTKEFQGYADIVHGGMLALVLDELMLNLLWKQKMPAVTAEMSVRFLKPARVGQPVQATARIRGMKGRLIEMEAEAKNANGKILSIATAKCIRIPS